MEINNRYNLQMEVITPLHVGAAQEKHLIEGLDYFYNANSNEILFLDTTKLFRKRPDIINFLLEADYEALKPIVLRNPEFTKRKVPFFNHPGANIKTQIKNGLTGKPIVPGSSIKGALRSILFKYLRQPNQQTNEEVFGRLNVGNDFMRFVRVTDAEFQQTSYVTAKIYNLRNVGINEWKGGWKHGYNNTTPHFDLMNFTTTFEVIPSEEKASFDLMLSPKLFDLFYNNNHWISTKELNHDRKTKLLHAENPIKALFQIINNHTREYLNAELEFFREFNQGENADDLVAQIEEYLLPFLEIENSCLMRMASGSGFHAITGNWQHPTDHIATIYKPLNGYRYKSRRIAIETSQEEYYLLPMGFVLITYNQ